MTSRGRRFLAISAAAVALANLPNGPIAYRSPPPRPPAPAPKRAARPLTRAGVDQLARDAEALRLADLKRARKAARQAKGMHP